MPKRLKVAVIGVRGIGRHHARWYDLVGCEVVAFAGTSPESCAAGESALKKLFDFRGRAYVSVDEMLRCERPDIVDVSSPPQFHREHCLAALEAGAHVMCEKPFVWDERKSPDELLANAEEVVRAAEDRGLALALSTQYAAAAPVYRRIHEELAGPIEEVGTVRIVMESVPPGGGSEYEAIWIDLGPHPISMVMAWLPEGEIEPGSISCRIGRKEIVAGFRYGDADVSVTHRSLDKGVTPTRCLGVNGFLLDWGGRPDSQGVFRTCLSREGREWVVDDFMHTTIARFVDGVCGVPSGPIFTTGRDGLKNLRILLEVLRHSRRV